MSLIDSHALQELALLPFDGKTRSGSVVGDGPRRGYIVQKLREAGLRPQEDAYGNVWAEHGREGEWWLQSSHMDVEPARSAEPAFAIERGCEGVRYRGDLDNAVGCYLNLLAAAKGGPARTLYAFTASEEEDPETEEWAIGARNAVKELERRGIRPELSIALDVSPARLRISQEEYDAIAMSNEEWDATSAARIYDPRDRTHCYIDGFASDDTVSRERATAALAGFVKRYGSAPVAIREFAGYDEAAVYRAVSPTFAFGPVFSGKQDEPDQRMPKAHVETAARFLQSLADSRQ